MSLRVYNTLGYKMEEFIPIKKNEVGFYGCGPTVYNYAHIGNLRAYVFQDTLSRLLRFLGYSLTHVMNITDIGHLSGDADDGEDKMVKTAQERGQSVLEIADFYTAAFFKDTDRLNIKRPNVVCKATDHVPDMIELIKRIEANGHTYSAGGNLYYDITTFPQYGELAALRLEDLKAGARIEVDENKRNPHDFVLWFTKSKFENQALVWDSPWGKGYPGWHIECSAMSMKYLGEQFDIHTGGIDHIRIHHTNEIAQSQGATGKKWVKYWLHNEFLVMNKGKMSKSTGNFITLEKVMEAGFAPLDYRFLLLGGHYRSQLNFSWEAMETARNARRNLEQRISHIIESAGESAGDPFDKITAEDAAALLRTEKARGYLADFIQALEEDISTPRALSVVQQTVKEKELEPAEIIRLIRIFDTVLGLNLLEEAQSLENTRQTGAVENSGEIQKLVEERTEAKKRKDFQRADEIRAYLKTQGIVLEDTAGGTIWRKM
ncbi:MAG: cysteine--tRNA ligase [Treponema sp.]